MATKSNDSDIISMKFETSNAESKMDLIKKDRRFKHIPTDPRFKSMPSSERKFKVDTRFKKMFTDDKFKVNFVVDKRGRPVATSSSENMKKFYDLNSNPDGDDDEDRDVIEGKKAKRSKIDEEEKTPALKTAEVRDDDDLTSDEESSDAQDTDDDESDDESSGSEISVKEIPWNELDKDVDRSEDTSARLALCNVDWDRINSKDIFVLLNSFKPANGSILSVTIYPSEYGKQRMEEEKMNGPKELTEKAGDDLGFNDDADNNGNDDDDEDGNYYDMRKLRQYQFNRLRYYYAIVECDSTDTAVQIYNQCDGMEYESSSNRLDLRFVPDDEKFDSEIRDKCCEACDPAEYKPNIFVTSALNQTKIECTWDETPRDRTNITRNRYTDLKEIDKISYKNLLASSSSSSASASSDSESEKEDEEDTKTNRQSSNKDDNEDVKIQKYKQLLKLDKNSGSDDDLLQITWDNDLDKKKSKSNFTPKKANKDGFDKEKAELSLIASGSGFNNKKHFSYDKVVKNKLENKDDFKINVKDPRFEAIYTNHLYNVDPSSQLYKKTNEMEKLVSEKTKRDDGKPSTMQKSKNDDLDSMVNSIKNRSKFFKNSK